MKQFICVVFKRAWGCKVKDVHIAPCSVGMCAWGSRAVPVDAELPGCPWPWHTAPSGFSASRSFPAGAEAELKPSSLGPAQLFMGCGAGGAMVAAGSASHSTGESRNTSKPFPFAKLQQEIKGNPLTLGSVFPTQTWFRVCCFIPGFDPDTLWTHLKLCSQCVFAASSFHFLENTPVQLALNYPHRGCWSEKPVCLYLRWLKENKTGVFVKKRH